MKAVSSTSIQLLLEWFTSTQMFEVFMMDELAGRLHGRYTDCMGDRPTLLLLFHCVWSGCYWRASVKVAQCPLNQLIDQERPPFPQIDIIGAVMIVWRVRGKLSGLFYAVVCAAIMHTHMNRPNSCLLVRFSFSVVILCVTIYLC